MKATVIVDNIKKDDILGEWGLCVHIEYKGRQFLLDTGSSELFVENADKLGVDLKNVDYAVLSHAHYDHANGMERFFKVNDKAVFYLQEDAKENCYTKIWLFHKYIGIPKGVTEKYRNRITCVSGKYRICDEVYLLSHTTQGLEQIGKRENMYQRKGLHFCPDNFCHEQSLVFDTESGLVIFNSCSHGGVINIIHEAESAFPAKKVRAMIGGFHIFKRPENEIRELAEQIRKTGIEMVYTGHCSGKRGYDILREELGDMVHQLQVGLEMEF